jgi:hypothetical protein
VSRNRHLNVFVPYSRDAAHEDDLTRAAMIVVRYVPLARDALLNLAGGPGLTELTEPGEVNIQTRDALASETQGELERIISVFLTPDVTDPDAEPMALQSSDRGQRLDGVLRFGQELVLIVESKIWEGASSWQAEEINLGGRTAPEHADVVRVPWHDLLERWRTLQDLGLLGPAESLMLEDLFDLGDTWFPHLMPFRKLRQARGHAGRMGRFLRRTLQQATGIIPADRDNYVRLDEALGTQAVRRLYLVAWEKSLVLGIYPGLDQPQALRLYAEGRATRLAALENPEQHWWVWPELYLSFRNARYEQRLFLRKLDDLEEYVRRWSGDHRGWIHSYSVRDASTTLWPWLTEQGYASGEEDIEGFLNQVGNREVYLRPGMGAEHYWPRDDAERLDDAGTLPTAIHDEANKVLQAIDEPMLPGIAAARS